MEFKETSNNETVEYKTTNSNDKNGIYEETSTSTLISTSPALIRTTTKTTSRVNNSNSIIYSFSSSESTSGVLTTTDRVCLYPRASSKIIEKSLSSQVMEYYNKYSQTTNLNRFFSVSKCHSNNHNEGNDEADDDNGSNKYYYWSENDGLRETNKDKLSISLKEGIEIPRERKKWIRPPLIGQSSGVSTKDILSTCYNEEKIRADTPSSLPDPDPDPEPERELERELEPEMNKTSLNTSNSISIIKNKDKDEKIESQKLNELDNNNSNSTMEIIKIGSPTSSITSHKPLEWDSGADVGYNNFLSQNKNDKSLNKLCTIERMALTRGLSSAALRLDPEGTTSTNLDNKIIVSCINSSSNNNSNVNSNNKSPMKKPKANSTRIVNDMSGESDCEAEITPIVKTSSKNNQSDIITGYIIVNDNDNNLLKSDCKSQQQNTQTNDNNRRLKSSKLNLLKKSNSMHLIDVPVSSSSSLKSSAAAVSLANYLKRSQSELNLDVISKSKNKILINDNENPLNCLSTSSIATIVNKPSMCDKLIQTNLINEPRGYQSKGIQAYESQSNDDSFNQSDNYYKTENDDDDDDDNDVESAKIEKTNETKKKTIDNSKPPLPQRIISSVNKSKSSLPPVIKHKLNDKNIKISSTNSSNNNDDKIDSKINVKGGRASSSFEYFPGHIYENITNDNVAVGRTSRVSSAETTGGRSTQSTIPNTSSSLDEKLWGNSDSLLRDLERSLNVLKSLVDANKCDKQVKKRLIHHVIKRLVSTKYTDDKIEHNLEENVPWNPDNARNKIYRTEIIQALTQKKHNSTEESSDIDWKDLNRSRNNQLNRQELKEIIQLIANSENSDICEERNTDRTDGMQDGRKARMGLRNYERDHHHHHRQHRLQTDTDKSESSECFLPQKLNYKNTRDNKQTISNGTVRKISSSPPQSTTATSVTNTSNDISNYQMEDKNHHKKDKLMDWKTPTTISERRFEYERSHSRLGNATKLIDYVQMEKKNQLLWINNEINHLSNLKKLLEEPQTLNESEKKKVTAKKQGTSLEDTTGKKSLRDEQWSSHRNLAIGYDESYYKYLKKRNSSTQTSTTAATSTAVNHQNGYLENEDSNEIIVTGLMRNSSRELSNAYTQTITPQSSSTSRESTPWSPNHCCLHQMNKKDTCHCSRPINTSVASSLDVNHSNKSSQKEKLIKNSKKETKNRLNDKCKSEFMISDKQNDAEVNKKQCHCDYLSTNSRVSSAKHKTTSDTSCSNADSDRKAADKVKSKPDVKEKQDNKICRTCGVSYTADKKCQCVATYMKPVAYELSFEKLGRKPNPRNTSPPLAKENSNQTPNSSESCKTDNCNCSPTQPQLKDFLIKNKPECVDNIELRKKCLSEISQLTRLKKEKRMELLSINSSSSFLAKKKPVRRTGKSPKRISEEEMKMRLRLRQLRLAESRSYKKKQQEKEEQMRRNYHMAKLYCKKLQRKVLEGHVDLSQSYSVISNL